VCYVWIRLDPDVPREGRNDESDRQLSTVRTGTRVGKTGDEVRRLETAGAEPEAERSDTGGKITFIQRIHGD